MKIKYAAPCIIVLLCACSMLKQSAITQGVSGHIYLLSGNQMPVFGRAPIKGRPVSRDIYVYEPTTANKTVGASPLFSQINTKLIAHTRSDSTGYYAINLPAGSYSVFVKEGDKFFAAISDGNGTLNPVIVTSQIITRQDLTLNYNATY